MVGSAHKLLKVQEVCEMLGVSRSTLTRMIDRGDFSKPLKPSPGTSRWPKQAVDDYIEVLQHRDGL